MILDPAPELDEGEIRRLRLKGELCAGCQRARSRPGDAFCSSDCQRQWWYIARRRPGGVQ